MQMPRRINQIFNFKPICIDSSMGACPGNTFFSNSVSQYFFAETIWKQFLKKHKSVSQYCLVWKEVILQNKNLCVCKTNIYSKLLSKLMKEEYANLYCNTKIWATTRTILYEWKHKYFATKM